MKRILIILPLVLCFIISCQDKELENKLNQYQEKEALEVRNIDFAKKILKAIDNSNYDSLKIIFANDWKLYMGSSNEPMNFEDFVPLHKMFYTALPDYTHIIKNIFASGNYVVLQVDLTATHKGEFQGIPPSNKKIVYKAIQIYEIVDNKLKTVYAMDDELSLMTQLGMELKMKEANE